MQSRKGGGRIGSPVPPDGWAATSPPRPECRGFGQVPALTIYPSPPPPPPHTPLSLPGIKRGTCQGTMSPPLHPTRLAAGQLAKTFSPQVGADGPLNSHTPGLGGQPTKEQVAPPLLVKATAPVLGQQPPSAASTLPPGTRTVRSGNPITPCSASACHDGFKQQLASTPERQQHALGPQHLSTPPPPA